jgi:BirA family transcriptional regulator, biotin operon repressor / biotin---[acetyl-CoA-carboxylase] ligase
MQFLAPTWEDSLPSTNTAIHDRLAAGESLPSGFVLAAHAQTFGRGRKSGRTWIATPGKNLTASMLVRFDRSLGRQLPSLGLVVGLAVQRTLAQFDIPARLKWPNDVLVEARKMSGVLIETVMTPGEIAAIIGVGINVNMSPAELADIPTPATSMSTCTGREWSIPKVLDALLAELAPMIAQWGVAGFAPFRAAWLDASDEMSRTVRVTAADGSTLAGEITGLGAMGELLLTDPTGQLHSITEGDVVSDEGRDQ